MRRRQAKLLQRFQRVGVRVELDAVGLADRIEHGADRPAGGTAAVASFIIIFLGVSVAAILLGKIIKKVIRMTMLGMADRIGGACFGLLKAFFIGWIFVIAVSSLPFPGFAWTLKKSRTFSFFAAISPVLKSPMEVLQRGKTPLKKNPGHETIPDIGKILNNLKKMGGNNDSSHNKKSVPSTGFSTQGDSI